MKVKQQDFIIKFILTMLIMLSCLILIDLYIPLKRFIVGDRLMLGEVLSYIKIGHHLPITIAVSVALSYERESKKKSDQ